MNKENFLNFLIKQIVQLDLMVDNKNDKKV